MNHSCATSLSALLALLALAACAPGPTPPGWPSLGAHATVTAGELALRGGTDLYDALVRCRPMWLRAGRRTDWPPVGYLNGLRLADLSALAAVQVDEVLDVVLLTGPDATTRFGTGHSGGAIVVRVR